MGLEKFRFSCRSNESLSAGEELIQKTFESIYPESVGKRIALTPLKGDGSDRKWYRAACGGASIIVVEHGPPPNKKVSEGDAFTAIGRHLKASGAPVPEIYAYDLPSGIVLLEDCGDIHLQDVIKKENNNEHITIHYRAVIDRLITMQFKAREDFDVRNCLETPYYDPDVILNREARYFVEAFLKGHLGFKIDFQELAGEFAFIAKRALSQYITGFLHRDFQSRNILVRDGSYYFIDFQSGRLGPLQYDLASLLIDPYVELPDNIQNDLLGYYIERLSDWIVIDPDLFLEVYDYNALNRNLQVLGAFAYLSGVKQKHEFSSYIPAACKSLRVRLGHIGSKNCPRLNEVMNTIESKE